MIIAVSVLAAALLCAADARAKSSDAQVRELYEEGRAAYEAGNYVQAADLFEKCYTISGRSALLWNIASAWERQYEVDHKPEELRTARGLYDEFSRTEQHEKARVDALERIRRIDEKLDAPSAPAVPETPALLQVPSFNDSITEAPPPPPPRRNRHLGLWIGVPAAAAAVVVVAVTLAVTLPQQDAAAPKVRGGLLTISFP